MCLGFGCRVPEPQGPCLSDRECHADRICHEGRCRFVEEVRRDLAAQSVEADAASPVLDNGASSEPTPPLTPDPVIPPRATGAGAGTTMFMGDSRHSGRLPFDGPKAGVGAAWTYRTGSRIYASPVRVTTALA